MSAVSLERGIRVFLDGIDRFSIESFSNQRIAKIASKIIKGLAIGLAIFAVVALAISMGVYAASLLKATPFIAGLKKLTTTIAKVFAATLVKGLVLSFSTEI